MMKGQASIMSRQQMQKKMEWGWATDLSMVAAEMESKSSNEWMLARRVDIAAEEVEVTGGVDAVGGGSYESG